MKSSMVEELEKKVEISEEGNYVESDSLKIVAVLRRFVGVQQRRAEAYARLKRTNDDNNLHCQVPTIVNQRSQFRLSSRAFEDYMASGVESTYQQLCSEITAEFNDCSKQVLEMESQFLTAHCFREDLSLLLRSVQNQEKMKLQLTATIQVLKRAGRPSERLVSHENCRFSKPTGHECVHIQKITEASGTEEAEADAEFDNALKEAINGVQDAVTAINEHLEEVRYEIAALED
ncbi:hypothetical protein RDI58_024422 [Solanum bulbocastanum]|uniref:Uncharacterized protein n=1 Tax=Solanum bulbocastanum TaxID=147425 RepID=A0AAN8SY89_SOLBU